MLDDTGGYTWNPVLSPHRRKHLQGEGCSRIVRVRARLCWDSHRQSFMAIENHPLMDDFPFKTSINRGFPIAMFDCGKVMHTIQGSHPFLSIWAPWCPWISRVASPSAQKPLEWWKHLRISSFRLSGTTSFSSGMVSESKCAPPSGSSWNS